MKLNRSKYKGRMVYHHGAKVDLMSSSKFKNMPSEQSMKKSNNHVVLKNSSASSSNQILPKNNTEEEEKNDNDFFGQLEADDQIYEVFVNRGTKQDENKNFEEDKREVRRSQRRIARQSFADLNENGLVLDDSQEEEGYRLIKCIQYDNST